MDPLPFADASYWKLYESFEETMIEDEVYVARRLYDLSRFMSVSLRELKKRREDTTDEKRREAIRELQEGGMYAFHRQCMLVSAGKEPKVLPGAEKSDGK
jgi:hypothetical protein